MFHVALPPLRDRRQDIPAICSALIRDLNKKHQCRVTNVHPDALQRLNASSWPGNVRELRNVIERAVIMAGEGEIQLWHLPTSLVPERRQPAPQAPGEDVLQMPVGARMEEVEEAYLNLTLKYTNDNKTRAAEILGLSLRTLHNRLRVYGTRSSKGAAAD